MRSRGTTVLAVVFLLLGLNALAQSALRVSGGSDDPPTLAVLQLVIGATGLAAAWGSLRLRRWAPAAALAHGLATAGMLARLDAILGLPREARPGLWTGAVVVLAFDVWAAWYLQLSVARGARTARAAEGDAGGR